ncbi:MAG TPA: choice-of-anchor B family protein [Bacteroidia bacterium]|nr:choice-of-anchor B family protein [Bacteroidia bacterium]
MKKIILLFALLIGTQFTYGQIQNLQLLGQLNFGTSCAGVWQYVDSLGNEYALVGAGNGLAIVDVTVPSSPNLLFTVPGNNSLWREMSTYGHYVYAGTEGGGGITVVDLSDLPNSYNSHVYTGDGPIAGLLSSSHTVKVFDGYLYIFGSNLGSGGAIICNLNDPWNPAFEGMYTSQYVHDGFVYNDTLYSAEVYAGQFGMVDVTNKANPVLIGTQATPGAFCHNTWFSDDHRYLYTTDEKPNAPLGVFDLIDKQNIKLVETFYNDTLSSHEVHNVRVLNDFLYNPSYGSQLTIVDGARPDNLIEVARYHTGPSLCWDASPYLPSGNIIATDMSGVLYIFAPYTVRACYLEGNVTDINTGLPLSGAQVKLLTTAVQASSVINGDYKTGYPTPGTFDIECSRPGYLTQVISGVTLSTGILTTLDFQLEPLLVSGTVVDAATSQPVPFADVRVQNGSLDFMLTADANGTFALTSLTSGSFDITAAKWGWKSNCVNVSFPGPSQVTIPVDQGIYDDFTFDFGWSVSGNAADGMWEWGIPVGTVFSTTQANPAVDDSLDCSNRCWVTGNGGGGANDDDVDDGTTILTSPVFDLSSYTDPYVHYSRWFFEQFSSNPSANDTMFISLDNGAGTSIIESVTGPSATNSTWVENGFRVSNFLTPTANMTISIAIGDKPGSANPLEGGFDRFFVTEGPTGIQENIADISFSVFPNPFTDRLRLDFKNQTVSKVVLTDIAGREVYRNSAIRNNNLIIDGASILPGFYIVSVFYPDGSKSAVKVVKSR